MYLIQQIKNTSLLVLFLASLSPEIYANHIEKECDYHLVGTTPEELDFNSQLSFEMQPTHEALLQLINEATESIKIASFYIQLSAEAEFANLTSTQPGKKVLEALEAAIHERKVRVEIILGQVDPSWTNQEDLRRLREAGAHIYVFNVRDITGGVQHAKFVITDDAHLYLGSANMDWRSLTQVEELGVHFENCRPLANDLVKIFESWIVAVKLHAIPESIPESLHTEISKESPLTLMMDNSPTDVYLSASPKEFSGVGNKRTNDIDALVDTLAKAKKFAYISVMKYTAFAYKGPHWPVIENAMKAAADRGVDVKLMVSKSAFKRNDLNNYRSLNSYKGQGTGKIELKSLAIPTKDPVLARIPHARVSHSKYIVSDNSLYLGTSNFEQGYFTRTCGVSISITPKSSIDNTIVDHVKQLFLRDYLSDNAEQLPYK